MGVARSPSLVAGALGSSDCEQLGDGWLAQPINALSSVAFVVVGVAVVVAMMHRPVDRMRTIVYATCVAAIGIGSVAYHGPQPVGSQLAHDLPIVVTAWFVVVQDARLVSGRLRRDLLWFAVGAAVVTVAAVVEIGTVAPLTGAAIAAILALEIEIARRGRRLRGVAGRRAAAVVVGVAATAVASWALGRTDSPLCEPDDVLQPHALWHLLSAVTVGLWWWIAVWLPAGADGHAGARATARLTRR